MIAGGVDRPAGERTRFEREAVLVFVDLGSHGAKAGGKAAMRSLSLTRSSPAPRT
jgi:hypothetical protein